MKHHLLTMLILLFLAGCSMESLNSVNDLMGEESLGGLEITVLDRSGLAVTQCQVSAGDFWATTDEQGKALINGLEKGSCTVTANGSGLNPATAQIEVWPGKTGKAGLTVEKTPFPLDLAEYLPIDPGFWWKYRVKSPGVKTSSEKKILIRERKYVSSNSVSVLDLGLGKELLIFRNSRSISMLGDQNGAFREGMETMGFRMICKGQETRSQFFDEMGLEHHILWTVKGIEDVAAPEGIHENCLKLSRNEVITGQAVSMSVRKDEIWLAKGVGPVMFRNPSPETCDSLFFTDAILDARGSGFEDPDI
ncbi:MAG: hypothetical protein CVV64_09800 [Candidatus Wallbacteria bacterium HGW-Wallbacteria-1]|jgi:hypothetical protein|uniref:Carboxypeptidase regulatory-like domain-containing protein n=1 Tax=Candidatus Wallbacteria bacterium HGW-Wallbacteria-1 TaxID=2013854 RepID=A0A2N1PQM3_9BACT|nr:MAG: hypothetical protein CVV64_09800 [Candidatus Wallbacteria bacterium HGW-Wallbacteria-1]